MVKIDNNKEKSVVNVTVSVEDGSVHSGTVFQVVNLGRTCPAQTANAVPRPLMIKRVSAYSEVEAVCSAAQLKMTRLKRLLPGLVLDCQTIPDPGHLLFSLLPNDVHVL